MNAKKKAMIEALKKNLGVVTPSCESVGIHRQTHYLWMREDEEYKSEVEQMNDIALDFAESKLYQLIKSGNTAAVLFYMKTKGKDRGFVERQERFNKTKIEAANLIIEKTYESEPSEN